MSKTWDQIKCRVHGNKYLTWGEAPASSPHAFRVQCHACNGKFVQWASHAQAHDFAEYGPKAEADPAREVDESNKGEDPPKRGAVVKRGIKAIRRRFNL